MNRQVEAVDSKRVLGSNFRIPAIEGMGSGRGFKIKGFALPIGWQYATTALKQFDPSSFQRGFTDYLQLRELPQGKAVFDPQTGVLTEISIQTTPPSILTLQDDYLKTYPPEGYYSSPSDIPNLKTAITLMRFGGEFLEMVDQAIKAPETHAYIYSEDQGTNGEKNIVYRSKHLRLPNKFLQAEDDLFDQGYRKHFMDLTKNIAGRFGLREYVLINFAPNGLLTYITYGSGNNDYTLCQRPESLEHETYIPGHTGHSHNWVASPENVAALHGTVALYINTLLEWQERRQKQRPELPKETYIPRDW